MESSGTTSNPQQEREARIHQVNLSKWCSLFLMYLAGSAVVGTPEGSTAVRGMFAVAPGADSAVAPGADSAVAPGADSAAAGADSATGSDSAAGADCVSADSAAGADSVACADSAAARADSGAACADSGAACADSGAVEDAVAEAAAT